MSFVMGKLLSVGQFKEGFLFLRTPHFLAISAVESDVTKCNQSFDFITFIFVLS